MNVKIGNKNYALAFTFNSFKYISDFDMGAMQELERKPLMIIPMLSDLFYGAMNSKRDSYTDRDKCDELLEKYLDDNSPIELFESLVTMLTETSFFKNLQQK